MSATPRPWKREERTVAGPAHGIRISTADDVYEIAEIWGDAYAGAWCDNDNAELIILAVNSHDALVSALEWLYEVPVLGGGPGPLYDAGVGSAVGQIRREIKNKLGELLPYEYEEATGKWVKLAGVDVG